jgi:hypothetical protein
MCVIKRKRKANIDAQCKGKLYSVVFQMLLKKFIMSKGRRASTMPKEMVSQHPWVDISN